MMPARRSWGANAMPWSIPMAVRSSCSSHPADVQDRDGAVPLLKQSRSRHPFVEHAFADSAYNSPRVADATTITIEIVRKFADQTGFVVHPRRWLCQFCVAAGAGG